MPFSCNRQKLWIRSQHHIVSVLWGHTNSDQTVNPGTADQTWTMIVFISAALLFAISKWTPGQNQAGPRSSMSPISLSVHWSSTVPSCCWKGGIPKPPFYVFPGHEALIKKIFPSLYWIDTPRPSFQYKIAYFFKYSQKLGNCQLRQSNTIIAGNTLFRKKS